MSAPIKQGQYISTVDDVKNGSSISISGGYVVNVSQSTVSKAARPEAENGRDLPDFADLRSMVSGNSALTEPLDKINEEVHKNEAGNALIVQDNLRKLSEADQQVPGFQGKLKIWLEQSPGIPPSIRILARNMLA